LDARRAAAFDQGRGADRVGAQVLGRPIERRRGRRRPREMEHRVDRGEVGGRGGRIGDLAVPDLDARDGQLQRRPRLWTEPGADPRAARDQRTHHRGADEPAGAGDQDMAERGRIDHGRCCHSRSTTRA
jgi:hypothetical protein